MEISESIDELNKRLLALIEKIYMDEVAQISPWAKSQLVKLYKDLQDLLDDKFPKT